jgi:hypothetical protein
LENQFTPYLLLLTSYFSPLTLITSYRLLFTRSLILNPQRLRALRVFIFFAVVKPVVIFGFDNSCGISGSFAAGWQEEKRHDKVQKDSFHELEKAKIVLF